MVRAWTTWAAAAGELSRIAKYVEQRDRKLLYHWTRKWRREISFRRVKATVNAYKCLIAHAWQIWLAVQKEVSQRNQFAKFASRLVRNPALATAFEWWRDDWVKSDSMTGFALQRALYAAQEEARKVN